MKQMWMFKHVISLIILVYSGSFSYAQNTSYVGQECGGSNPQCPDGTVCVAGSAQEPVLRCVQYPVCGGSIAGNCPALASTGQLICTWVNSNQDCLNNPLIGCKDFNGVKGIYKCLSTDRCDATVGNGQCSGTVKYAKSRFLVKKLNLVWIKLKYFNDIFLS